MRLKRPVLCYFGPNSFSNKEIRYVVSWCTFITTQQTVV